MMFSNKRFDVANNIIIDVRYVSTFDLYELIFKISDDALWKTNMENDMHTHVIGDECAQIQVLFVGSIIEQRGIQVQILNCAVNVG